MRCEARAHAHRRGYLTPKSGAKAVIRYECMTYAGLQISQATDVGMLAAKGVTKSNHNLTLPHMYGVHTNNVRLQTIVRCLCFERGDRIFELSFVSSYTRPV